MDLFSYDPHVPTFPVIEVGGIRAIVEATSWRSFYAIDEGQPFPSETGFRSAGSMIASLSHEQAFAAIIAEQTKGEKGRKGAEGPKKALPIPDTVYRLPHAGEDSPQPSRGRMVALSALMLSPLNPTLILAAYRSRDDDGRVYENKAPDHAGDLEHWAYERGLHRASVLARAALSPEPSQSADTAKTGGPDAV